jgi:hypothetical protein
MNIQGLTQTDWKQLKDLLTKANDEQLSEIRRQCLTEGWQRQSNARETLEIYIQNNIRKQHGI